jgi:hypothetical protein
MRGFSPRNLKYMRALAQAWPDAEFVQQPAAQLPWFHRYTLLDKVKGLEQRDWYAGNALEHGWSRQVVMMHCARQLAHRPPASVCTADRTFSAPPAAFSHHRARVDPAWRPTTRLRGNVGLRSPIRRQCRRASGTA